MSQRALLYTVAVKRKFHREYALLGDIDGAGERLIDLLRRYTTDLSLESEDLTKTVTSVPVAWPPGEEDEEDELYVSLRHGERDVAAEIYDEQGVERYRQKLTDEARLRCGALFVLPADQERGWAVLHQNSGRGVKGLLGPELMRRFAQTHDDHMLELNPWVDMQALQQAVDDGAVRDVRLTKLVKPGDVADEATERWIPDGEVGKIEVKFYPRGRGKFLDAGPLRALMHSDDKRAAGRDIVEFQGIPFDEARVAVVLPGGTERTFYIQRDTPAGHPWALDIDGQVEKDADGNPTDVSLRNALRSALAPVL